VEEGGFAQEPGRGADPVGLPDIAEVIPLDIGQHPRRREIDVVPAGVQRQAQFMVLGP